MARKSKNTNFNQNKENFLKLADDNLKNGNYEQALNQYSTILKRNPKMALALKNRGLCKQKLGFYSEAIKDLKTAKQLDPNYIPVYFNLAQALFESDDYISAKDAFFIFLEKLEEFHFKFTNEIYLKLKSDTYRHLSLIESSFKNLDSALSYIKNAFEVDSHETDNLIYAKGIIFLENNLLNYAFDEFDKISPESPLYLNATLNKCAVLEKKNEYESAIKLIAKLSEKYPFDEAIEYNFGIILLKQKLYIQSIEKLTNNINLLESLDKLSDSTKKKLTLSYNARSYCFLSINNFPKSLEDSRKSLIFSPNNLNATHFLSYALLENKLLTPEIYNELFKTSSFYLVNVLEKIFSQPETTEKSYFLENIRKKLFIDFKKELNIENNENIDLTKTFYMYKQINEYTFKSLEENGIYKNNPKRYNDPFDPYFKRFKVPISNLLEKIKISCLTESCDNLLMWAHYADEHRGICIGYKIKKLDKFTCFNKIKYDSIETNSEYNIFPISTTGTVYTLHDIFIKKHPDWKYEKEYRLIHLPNNNNNDYFKDIEIKEIIFGLECPEDSKNEIINKIKNPKIEFYEMIEGKNLSLIKQKLNITSK